jgi:hypothetical protein
MFKSQPQIEFKLPDGPYNIEVDENDVVHVTTKNGRPVLMMNKDTWLKMGLELPEKK